MELKGIPAAPGCASGGVKIVRSSTPQANEPVVALIVEEEVARFYVGREACRKHYEVLLEACRARGAEQEAAVFVGHRELILGTEIEKAICEAIAREQLSAEAAAAVVFDKIIEDMEALPDIYLRDRAFDFLEIKRLLARGIRGESLSATQLEQPSILVGHELGPAETAFIDPSLLLAVVSETGGATSHLAIFAQNLAIPAVVGVPGVVEALQDGDEVHVDGTTGSVFVQSDEETTQLFQSRRECHLQIQQVLYEVRDLPTQTLDGTRIALAANVDSDAGVEAAVRFGAEGVGLFRTEFLYFGAKPPSEEAQYRVYRKAVTRMSHNRVVFRTFDLGGDKPPPWLPQTTERNPFLGWRGARLYGKYRDLLKAQLRAILRAANHGDAAIMFPMVIGVGELQELIEHVEEAKQELRREGIPFGEELAIGTMIETPAAAIVADKLLDLVDFVSLGTNDLVQYTLAVDRGNERVAELYDWFHPAVVRLVRDVIRTAGARNKIASMCGEMCGDERATALLLGLGLRSFSVSPAKAPLIKKAIRETDLAAAERLAEEAMAQAASREIRQLVDQWNSRRAV